MKYRGKKYRGGAPEPVAAPVAAQGPSVSDGQPPSGMKKMMDDLFSNIMKFFGYLKETFPYSLVICIFVLLYIYFLFFYNEVRELPEDEKVRCDSFDECPAGQRSNEDLICDEETGCDVETCCIAIDVCDSSICSSSSVLNPDMDGQECEEEECSEEECCLSTCYEFNNCPSSRVVNPDNICDNYDNCTVQECCVAQNDCSSHTCSGDYSMNIGNSVQCLLSGCDDETCCGIKTCEQAHTNLEEFCRSEKPEGYAYLNNLPTNECSSISSCTTDSCCTYATCSNYRCTSGTLKSNSEDIYCSSTACSDNECCDITSGGESEPTSGGESDTTCSSFVCPSGTSLIDNAELSLCSQNGNGECTQNYCCNQD